MQIHELTKRNNLRTDEGILDGLKDAVKQKATAVYKDTTKSVKDTYAATKGAVTGIPGQVKQDYHSGIKSAKRGGEENPFLARMSGVKNTFTAAGDRWDEKQRNTVANTQQDKINKQAQDAAKILARKGFNVDPNAQLAKASTPANIAAGTAGPQFQQKLAQQKLAQQTASLQKKFDAEFNLGGGVPMANKGEQVKVQMNNGTYIKGSDQVWRNEQGKPVDKQSIAALDARANTQYQVNPGAAEKYAQQKAAGVNPRAQPIQPIQPIKPTTTITKESPEYATPGGIVIPAGAKTAASPASATGKKSIQKDFKSWIASQIPNLSQAMQDPATKQQLDQAFKAMAVAKNPKAIDAAFRQYVGIALQSTGAQQAQQTGQQTGQQGTSALDQFNAYSAKNKLSQAGLTPQIMQSLKKQLSNRELNANDLINTIKNS